MLQIYAKKHNYDVRAHCKILFVCKHKDALSRFVLISNLTNGFYRTTLIAILEVIGRIQIRWSHVRVVTVVAVVVVIAIFWGKSIILLLGIY